MVFSFHKWLFASTIQFPVVVLLVVVVLNLCYTLLSSTDRPGGRERFLLQRFERAPLWRQKQLKTTILFRGKHTYRSYFTVNDLSNYTIENISQQSTPKILNQFYFKFSLFYFRTEHIFVQRVMPVIYQDAEDMVTCWYCKNKTLVNLIQNTRM